MEHIYGPGKIPNPARGHGSRSWFGPVDFPTEFRKPSDDGGVLVYYPDRSPISTNNNTSLAEKKTRKHSLVGIRFNMESPLCQRSIAEDAFIPKKCAHRVPIYPESLREFDGADARSIERLHGASMDREALRANRWADNYIVPFKERPEGSRGTPEPTGQGIERLPRLIRKNDLLFFYFKPSIYRFIAHTNIIKQLNVHSKCKVAHIAFMFRVGKKAAGRMLDGRVWDQAPEVTP